MIFTIGRENFCMDFPAMRCFRIGACPRHREHRELCVWTAGRRLVRCAFDPSLTHSKAFPKAAFGAGTGFASIGKLVIDVRAQLAATYYVNITDYYAYNETTDESRYFSFFADGEEDESGLSAYTAAGNFGWKTNFGATARYGVLGLALDYSPGAIRASYRASEGDGEAKFKNNVFQIKLSLTL